MGSFWYHRHIIFMSQGFTLSIASLIVLKSGKSGIQALINPES